MQSLRITAVVIALALLPFLAKGQINLNSLPVNSLPAYNSAADCGQLAPAPYGGPSSPDSLDYYFPTYVFMLTVLWLVAVFVLWPWLGQRRLPPDLQQPAKRVQVLTLVSATLAPVVLYLVSASRYFSGFAFSSAARNFVTSISGARPAIACLGGFSIPPGHGAFLILALGLFGLALVTLIQAKVVIRDVTRTKVPRPSLVAFKALMNLGIASALLVALEVLTIALNSLIYARA